MTATRIVRINYPIRTAAFGYSFLVIGLVLAERQAGPGAWAALAAQFLVYPHLAYFLAARSAHPSRAERNNLLADSALLGAWSAALGFPTWVTYAFFFSTTLNSAVYRGWRGALASVALFSAGAFVWVGTMGYAPHTATSAVVTALCFFGAALYTAAVGLVLHHQIRSLQSAREELRASEDRYRLIAENAGDLIGMVDRDGRWLYASPAHARILRPHDLEIGADAFRAVVEEDQLRVRAAVQSVIHGGGSASLGMRIADVGGAVRRLESLVHAVPGGDGAAKGAVIVSRDVTEKHRRDEQLEVAAHAFERMAEAIMITSADGRILMVNRAYSEITGYAAADVVGQPEQDFRCAMQPAEFYDDLYAEVVRSGRWSGATWARRANGTLYREWRSVSAVRDSEGRITHFVALFRELNGSQPAAARTA
jgi:PAS domain S-box-containing protein